MSEDIETKICRGSLCRKISDEGVEKPLTEFGKYRNGTKNYCKKCRSHDNKIYRNNNKEKIKKTSSLYYENNKNKIKKMQTTYYSKNRDKIKIKAAKNYKKDLIVKRQRLQERLQKQKFYIKHLIATSKARDKKLGRTCNIDYEYIKKLVKKQGNKCIYSGQELVWKIWGGIYQGSIDRIDSSKGYVKGNCQLVTIHINHFKLNLSHEKFTKLINLIKESFNKKFKLEEIISISELSSKGKMKINSLYNTMRKSELSRDCKELKKDIMSLGIDKEDAIKTINDNMILTGIKLDFDNKYIHELRTKQNDRCALTNVKVSWEPNTLNTASIDKIDPSKGYSKDNIQIVLWYVNFMKNDLPNETAVEILQQIVNYNE